MGVLGMQKAHLMAAGSRARGVLQTWTASLLQFFHGGANVPGMKRDVMHAGTAVFQETGHRPILAKRFQQLDLGPGILLGGVPQDTVDYTPQFGLRPSITSFGQDAKGELYLTLQTGQVYRIAPQ